VPPPHPTLETKDKQQLQHPLPPISPLNRGLTALSTPPALTSIQTKDALVFLPRVWCLIIAASPSQRTKYHSSVLQRKYMDLTLICKAQWLTSWFIHHSTSTLGMVRCLNEERKKTDWWEISASHSAANEVSTLLGWRRVDMLTGVS
jgi:hypothetical protein